MKMHYFYTLLFTVAFAGVARSQDIAVTIAADDFSTSDGALNDTNPVGNYGPNEDETITICAVAPETILNLYWVSFDLGAGDVLEIFDGSSTASPQIGSYTGQELGLVDITSTNPEGCLTLHWTSDATDEGEFGCVINCGAPCAKPITAITAQGETELPVLACPNEEFTFNASGTTFQNGATFTSVLWDFGDGTQNTTDWPSTTHSYPTAGIYKVNVYVTDSNGCQSLNVVNLKIYVSTDPIFSAVTDDNLVCVGQAVNLMGYAEGVTYDNVPNAGFGGGLFIPDNQGCFDDTLYVTGFAAGQTITSVDDFNNFFINYEHSFMSDFTVSFICPDGSGLIAHNQGGGGFWLGVACDDEGVEPGQGWDYYWAPDAVAPTWAEAALDQQYLSNPIDPCTGTEGSSLVSGTYSAVGDWNALVGCPLNGPWIIEICDIVGVDNGFIFDWSVNFDASLYPEDLTFTPVFDPGCEDTYWNGQFITDNGVNCDSVVVVPGAAGEYVYTYSATNNFGCTYTQDITIEAYPGPIANAGEDFYYCGEEVQLEGEVTNPVNGINYIYSWTPSQALSNPNVAAPFVENEAIDETTDFALFIYPSDDPNCIVSDTVTAIVPPYPVIAPLDSLRFCSGGTDALLAPVINNSYTYEWFYSPDGSSYVELDSNHLGNLAVTDGGFYYVEVYEPVCNFMSVTPYFVIVKSCAIFIPNIFTPNGNGDNDSFVIRGLEDFANSTLQVYNRWGNLVYESDNYKNNWKADDLAEGTYFFILGVNTVDGMDYHQGDVTILRK
jgi:gliding motility-associated-like protein